MIFWRIENILLVYMMHIHVGASVESQKGIKNYLKMFHWEPKGHYHCTESMHIIVPFWFSKEHHSTVLCGSQPMHVPAIY